MRSAKIFGQLKRNRAITVYMTMRRNALATAFLAVATPAMADTFSGFSGVDRPYLLNQDRLCTPLKVANNAATGSPTCTKAEADVVARMSIKDPNPQRGAKAAFLATASGRTLTVTRRSGDTVVTWESTDPILKVVEVYASQYEDRVAVAYNVRSLGKETTAVIAFDLQGSAKTPDPTTNPTNPTTTNPVTKTPDDPKLTKAIADARKAGKGAPGLKAWQAVLAIDPQHAEAKFNVAALQVAAKATADGIATLAELAASTRDDAIEWIVEARFDPQFAAVRADPKYRAAVGLDKKPTTTYERMMGFGGQWEQTGTSCDKPEIRLAALRDRTFKLRVKTTCEGQVYDTPFKGTWAVNGAGITLTFPNRGRDATAKDTAPCVFEKAGDEEAIHCTIDRDLEFTILPARR